MEREEVKLEFSYYDGETLLTGPMEKVIENIKNFPSVMEEYDSYFKSLKDSFHRYELNLRTDYDSSWELCLIGVRYENDAEFDKRKKLLEARKEAAIKAAEKKEERRLQRIADKEKKDHEEYLRLKEKFEK